MTQHLTPQQLRAARGLLDWSRGDLADMIGVSEATITRFENGKNGTEPKTLEKIAQSFDGRGVEFLDNDGVRFKPQGIEVLNGTAGLQQFFDDVYDYTRRHGGSIVQFGVREQLFRDCIGPDFSDNYLARMTAVFHSRTDMRVRAILCEGDTNFLASAYNEYRWISKQVFQAVPFYIYGDRLAIVDFHTDPGPTILRLNFPAITKAYRAQFEAFWQMAKVPPRSQN